MAWPFSDKKQTDNKILESNNPSSNTMEREEQNSFAIKENEQELKGEPEAAETVEETKEGSDLQAPEDEVILPPEPELDPPVSGIVSGVSYWGFSQRGESHVVNGTPCQDRCVIDVVNASMPLIVAAIADGVGSCMLSHYGAAKATHSAVDYLKKELIKRSKLDDTFVGDLLRAAMSCAYEAVHNEAEEMEQLEYSFQSTLTLAIYDGSTLYFSHAGDDGIVAILNDGTMDLATVRKKGEEASSVLPLQSLDWETRKSTNVNAFIMATDGVLDAFVRGEKEENRIYYPFIEPAVQPGQISDTKVKEVADFYYNYMGSPEYRAMVTDDLTMVVITNQRKITKVNLPKFDQEAWNKYSAERDAEIKAALYPEEEPHKKKNDRYDTSQLDKELTTQKGTVPRQENTLYCRYCGTKIIDKNPQFCPACGRRIQLTNPYTTFSSTSPYKKSEHNIPRDEINIPNISNERHKYYSENPYSSKNTPGKSSYSSGKNRRTKDYDDNEDYEDDRFEPGLDILTFVLGGLVALLVIFILMIGFFFCL